MRDKFKTLEEPSERKKRERDKEKVGARGRRKKGEENYGGGVREKEAKHPGNRLKT